MTFKDIFLPWGALRAARRQIHDLLQGTQQLQKDLQAEAVRAAKLDRKATSLEKQVDTMRKQMGETVQFNGDMARAQRATEVALLRTQNENDRLRNGCHPDHGAVPALRMPKVPSAKKPKSLK